MTQSCEHQHASVEFPSCPLFKLLANSLVLSQTAPYLSCYDVLNLAATAKAFRFLIYNTPNVFRRLDLSRVKAAHLKTSSLDGDGESWNDVHVERSVTRDEYYSDPILHVFSRLRRLDIFRDVQVLCLDGLSVTAELVHAILTDPNSSIRILSIRGVKNLNEKTLRGALQYACRESRPEGMPRLKGLYVFGPQDCTPAPAPRPDTPGSSPGGSPTPVASVWNNRSQQALSASLADEPEAWWVRRGSQFPSRIDPEWANTLVACAGVIAFDAVLCPGPRHFNSPAWGTLDTRALDRAVGGSTHFAVATHSLGGCASCGSAPEGWTVWGEDSECPEQTKYGGRRSSESSMSDLSRFPLLAPPPMHSASIRVAMCPAGQPVGSYHPNLYTRGKQQKARFIPRCFECIRPRYCAGCHRWWCEACYTDPRAASPAGGSPVSDSDAYVSRSCLECGMNCKDCMMRTQRICSVCKGGYCLIHNEGSNQDACDWCAGRGRRRWLRDLY